MSIFNDLVKLTKSPDILECYLEHYVPISIEDLSIPGIKLI